MTVQSKRNPLFVLLCTKCMKWKASYHAEYPHHDIEISLECGECNRETIFKWAPSDHWGRAMHL